MRIAVGFDTSCYTTSAAAVNEREEVVAFSRMLLPVGEGQRGLRQSEAVFAHVRQMPQVMKAMSAQLPQNAEIVAVCASAKPRNEQDSYMPVFTVGLGHASVLADATGVPLVETSHQQGHIAAGLLGNPAMEERFIALHLSGGTTELLACHEENVSLIGGSLDLHAGQLVDRVGVALGLGFPAGPALEKLAMGGAGSAEALLPASMEQGDLYCHLSGAETKALAWVEHKTYEPERIAVEVFDLLARTVSRLLMAGCRQEGAKQALVVGGVASSELLRGMVLERVKKARAPVRVVFGDRRYSADNAAGVAAIGMRRYLESIKA